MRSRKEERPGRHGVRGGGREGPKGENFTVMSQKKFSKLRGKFWVWGVFRCRGGPEGKNGKGRRTGQTEGKN